MQRVLPLVGLLVLPWLNAALAITVKFLAISAKAVFAEGLSYFCHELEVVRQVVDGVELGAQDFIRLLKVV